MDTEIIKIVMEFDSEKGDNSSKNYRESMKKTGPLKIGSGELFWWYFDGFWVHFGLPNPVESGKNGFDENADF